MERRLKVLYLATGGSLADRNFLGKLVDLGYETTYVYLRPSGRDCAVPGLTQFCLNNNVSRQDSWLSFRVWRHLRSFLNFRTLLKRVQPDVVHAGHVQGTGLMAAVSGFHPFLLMPWGSDVLIHPKRSWLFRKATQYVLKRADLITCDADSVKKEMMALVPDTEKRIKVIPWGVDLQRFQPSPELRHKTRRRLGLESHHRVMVMTRWFKPIYGIEYFLQALPTVLQQIPNARAVLVGSGPLETELRELTHTLGIENAVHFVGAVANDELPGYLNAGDVYVSSSLSDGTSISLLEAMACGLPAVLTDVPSNLEWVEPGVNGAIVPRRAVEPLSQALISMLEDAHMAHKMGERNRGIVAERANWDRNFSEIEELYNTLVENKREKLSYLS